MNLNDKVKVVKLNDKHNGEIGTIIKVSKFLYVPVTVYKVKFNEFTKEYFYSDLKVVYED